MGRAGQSTKKRIISIISILVIAILIGVYIYFLRTGEAQKMIHSVQNLGFGGVLIGILIQTIANVIPVPGEFISIILMEIYGPVWGGVFSWFGGVAGAIIAFYLTKWIAKPFFGKMTQPYLQKVNAYIQERGTIGLLMIRFVPLIPYHFVNYAAGLLNVKLLGFVWTTGIGILPYTIMMSGIFAGVRHGSLVWGFVGAAVFLMLLGASRYAKKRMRPAPND